MHACMEEETDQRSIIDGGALGLAVAHHHR